jgi:hypothetical protein
VLDLASFKSGNGLSVVGKLLNVAAGAIWTLGFVVCSPLNASLPGYSSTVLSNLSEQAALKSTVSIHSNPGELFDLSVRSAPVDNLVAIGKIDSEREREAPILWSQAEEVPFAQGSNSLSDTSIVLERERFSGIMQTAIAHSFSQRPVGNIVQAIAHQLLGSSYQPNLLDRSYQESLIVSLSQFDCVLFVETVLAIARGVAVQDYSYKAFTNHLQNQRYRDGKLNGYCSRLHYFSEWIANNQQRGNVLNLTLELGGVSRRKPLSFMSDHRSSYPRLVKDNATYRCIQQIEAKLDPFTLSYIPTERIHQIYSRLRPGDIVAIATDIPGLDVTHTGLVYRSGNGAIGLIHAAPNSGVKISPDLQAYVSRVDNAIGILVARSTDPRVQTSMQPLQAGRLFSQFRHSRGSGTL